MTSYLLDDAKFAALHKMSPLGRSSTAQDVASAVLLALAAVGGFGLTLTLDISIVERTRELAVMKTLGATRNRLIRLIVGEAHIVAVLSVLAAFVLSLPLSRPRCC